MTPPIKADYKKAWCLQGVHWPKRKWIESLADSSGGHHLSQAYHDKNMMMASPPVAEALRQHQEKKSVMQKQTQSPHQVTSAQIHVPNFSWSHQENHQTMKKRLAGAWKACALQHSTDSLRLSPC